MELPTGPCRAESTEAGGLAHLRLQACRRLRVVVDPAHAVVVLAVPVGDVQLPPVAFIRTADLQAEGEEMPARICTVSTSEEKGHLPPQDARSTGSL